MCKKNKNLNEVIKKLTESGHCRYEVRFAENPDPAFSQSFNYRAEADDVMQEYPDAELYLVCDPEFCDNDELVAHNYEIQLVGPEADQMNKEYDENTPDWFDSDMDSTDYTDKNGEFPREADGSFRAPKFEDDLDEESFDLDSIDQDDPEDDMSDVALGEALFRAITRKDLC